MLQDPKSPELRFLYSLLAEDRESEWLEFKTSSCTGGDDIGEYISALSNGAALVGRQDAWMVWGVHDETHEIVGTTFDPKKKVQGQDIEHYIASQLNPKIDFHFDEILVHDKKVVLLQIERALLNPVKFKKKAYIRVKSHKRNLDEFTDKERLLWARLSSYGSENRIVGRNVPREMLPRLLDLSSYSRTLNTVSKVGVETLIEYMINDEIIYQNVDGTFNVALLGAILFARDFREFDGMSSRDIRVYKYRGRSKSDIDKKFEYSKGIATVFDDLVNVVRGAAPPSVVINTGIREEREIPLVVIRELITNAIMHQDFAIDGRAVTIEIFDDRIEITNAGKPLMPENRLLDMPPQSRNERLSDFMRKLRMAEQMGSGIDRAVEEMENSRFPSPIHTVGDDWTRVVIKNSTNFSEMTKREKVFSCYLHASLQYMRGDRLTNASLRKRFGLHDTRSSEISRLIKTTIEEGLVKDFDPQSGNKSKSYVPFWAS